MKRPSDPRSILKELRAAVLRLHKEKVEAERMVEVYKKAKAENDDRFMIERDAALARCSALGDDVARLLEENRLLRERLKFYEVQYSHARIQT